MHTLELLWKTVLLRPYVFVFLAAFLTISVPRFGLGRTLSIWWVTWLVAFISEFASTRIGIPYGHYSYNLSTLGQELYIFNVPFMDSLSFSFLLFASFSMALLTLAPLRVKAGGFWVLDNVALRSHPKTAFLTAFYMMMIDVVIDPIAFRGDQWFLGKIYDYREHGHYFGIPLSNAFGWFIVGLVSMLLIQQVERRFFKPSVPQLGIHRFGIQDLLGPGLYLGVLLFNLVVTAWIREWSLLIAGCFIFSFPLVLLVCRCFDPNVRASEETWKTHLWEYGFADTIKLDRMGR